MKFFIQLNDLETDGFKEAYTSSFTIKNVGMIMFKTFVKSVDTR